MSKNVGYKLPPYGELLESEKAILVEVKGRQPGLLQQNPIGMVDEFMGGRQVSGIIKKGRTVEQMCKAVEYRTKEGLNYIPNTWFYGTLLNSCSAYKINKRSAVSYVAGLTRVLPSEIPITLDGKPIEKYDAFVTTVNLRPQGRIPRARPWFKEWEAAFHVIYDTLFGLTSAHLHQWMSEAGRRIGVGDFRPQHKGPYGTFVITKWEDL